MKTSVSSSIFLLISLEWSLSPYNRIRTRTSLGWQFIWTNGGHTTETSARRCRRRWTSNEGQSSKKWSVSLILSFVGQIGLTVSLKLYLNLWKFSLLRPTLIWDRYKRPVRSWIPKTGLARGGAITERGFVLKTVTDGGSLISGPSLFHSEVQLGWNLDWAEWGWQGEKGRRT